MSARFLCFTPSGADSQLYAPNVLSQADVRATINEGNLSHSQLPFTSCHTSYLEGSH
jgi:hypothetical protein